MSIIRNKNIFSEINNNKSIFSLNVFKYYGNRFIDTLIHYPISYVDNNYKNEYQIDDVGKIITLDIQVLEHIKSFNQKSPLKIITQTNSKQILNILFFGSFKSFYIKKFQINNFYRITGKLQFFSNTYQIIHPINILNNENSKSFENIEPIYNLSRKKY